LQRRALEYRVLGGERNNRAGQGLENRRDELVKTRLRRLKSGLDADGDPRRRVHDHAASDVEHPHRRPLVLRLRHHLSHHRSSRRDTAQQERDKRDAKHCTIQRDRLEARAEVQSIHYTIANAVLEPAIAHRGSQKVLDVLKKLQQTATRAYGKRIIDIEEKICHPISLHKTVWPQTLPPPGAVQKSFF
jgi:hypothetical protein